MKFFLAIVPTRGEVDLWRLRDKPVKEWNPDDNVDFDPEKHFLFPDDERKELVATFKDKHMELAKQCAKFLNSTR